MCCDIYLCSSSQPSTSRETVWFPVLHYLTSSWHVEQYDNIIVGDVTTYLLVLFLKLAPAFPKKPIAHLQGDDTRTTPSRRSTSLGWIWGWTGFLQSFWYHFVASQVMTCCNVAPNRTRQNLNSHQRCHWCYGCQSIFPWQHDIQLKDWKRFQLCSPPYSNRTTVRRHVLATHQGWETWKQKEQIQLEWEEQHLGFWCSAFDDPVCHPTDLFDHLQSLKKTPKGEMLKGWMDDVLMVASPRQLAVENEARYDEHDDRNRSGPLAVQDGEMRRGGVVQIAASEWFWVGFHGILEDGQNQTSIWT